MKDLKPRDYVLIGDDGFVVDWVGEQPFRTSCKIRLRRVGVSWWLSWLTWFGRSILTDAEMRGIERAQRVGILPYQHIVVSAD